MASTSSVRVAVRVRPLTETERQHNCKNNITFVPNEPQIIVGPDRSFTFDYAYTPLTGQQEVFNTCVIPLVTKYMDGYNSTILAYGQTGSGKTFSMGIGLDAAMNPVGEGIVPLFINTLFERIQQKRQGDNQFDVSVSFLELYNEDIVDLLCPTKKENPNLSIREDHHGNIHWSGVREEKVINAKELFDYLKKGSIARTTASTDMNHTSSRSHAIFSVVLKQTLYDDTEDQLPVTDGGKSPTSAAILSPTSSTNSTGSNTATPLSGRKLISKFHFVDLAGSERLKRTNAVGDRAKEGISINSGLLALGNVISALGDESRRVSHIPYRDSKLTRLLQDSLGGNSQTLMLACVSPADFNHTETLNTLKYANRARNIRNRVVINQETTGTGGGGNVETEQRLKATIVRLKDEIRGNDDFLRAVNDEMDGLKISVQHLQGSMSCMATELAQVKCERDLLRTQLQQHQRQHQQGGGDETSDGGLDDIMQALMNEYTQTIEQLKLQLQQYEYQQKQKQQQPGRELVNGSNVESDATIPSKDHPHRSSVSTLHPVDNNRDTKRKRHSYRIGSLRRSLKGRRRTSIGSATPRSSPKPEHSPTFRNTKQIKADIRQDIQFIQATQASLDSLDLTTPTDDLGDGIFSMSDNVKQQQQQENGKSSSSASQGSSSLPSVASVNTYQPLSITPASLCRQLIQRFVKSVDGKQLLLQQIERVEQQKRDSVQQLERKLSEDKQKKAQIQNQHKQKICELTQQHEQKQRKQLTELQTLRRKHTQLVNSSATARTQQENAIRNLKTSLEDAKHDKKKALKRMKQELNRFREKCQQHEREMEKGKRLEKQVLQTKKKMERDLAQARSMNKKLGEENQALQLQVKHLAMMAKKSAITSNTAQHQQQQQQHERQGAYSMPTKLTSGTLAASLLPTPPTSTLHQRGYHHHAKRISKKDTATKFISVQQRVIERKRLILRAIAAHAKSQIPTRKINELYEKRNRLIQEQEELLKERELVVQDQMSNESAFSTSCDDPSLAPQYMDERIDAITPEIDLLNYCIQQLEGPSSPSQKQKQKQQQDHSALSNDSNNAGKIDEDWVDVVDQDTHIVTDALAPSSTVTSESGISGYEIALNLVRTLEMEEPRLVCESLVEDLIELKHEQYTNHMLTSHLTATLNRHQEALIQMRRNIHERRHINTSAISTMLDECYQRAFHGQTQVWNGLVLLSSSLSPPSLSSSCTTTSSSGQP